MWTFFRNIQANGDVIGGNKTVNNLPPRTQLDMLNELYKNEIENNHATSELIDDLHHYKSSRHTNRDLSSKLDAAGFNYIIPEAEELKELVSKLIVKHQNYKSAQQIITYLLSKVESTFNAYIKPKLHDVNDEYILKQILKEFLQDEISIQLGENVLNIYDRQINGMMFFLTGNCHLEWE